MELTKRIVLELPPEEYAILRQQAATADRDAWQQARHIVRAALIAAAQPTQGGTLPLHQERNH